MTDTPLSDNPNPNTPFHTDPKDEPGDSGDEPTDEPSGDPVLDEPTDDEDEGNSPAGGDEPVKEKAGGNTKAKIVDASGAIVGPHDIDLKCTCDTCTGMRKAQGL
jgi:hypothetical protein